MFPPSVDSKNDKTEIIETYNISLSDLSNSSALQQVLLETAKDEMTHEIDFVFGEVFKRMDAQLKQLECEGCLNFMFIYNKEYPVYQSTLAMSKAVEDFYNIYISVSQ